MGNLQVFFLRIFSGADQAFRGIRTLASYGYKINAFKLFLNFQIQAIIYLSQLLNF